MTRTTRGLVRLLALPGAALLIIAGATAAMAQEAQPRQEQERRISYPPGTTGFHGALRFHYPKFVTDARLAALHSPLVVAGWEGEGASEAEAGAPQAGLVRAPFDGGPRRATRRDLSRDLRVEGAQLSTAAAAGQPARGSISARQFSEPIYTASRDPAQGAYDDGGDPTTSLPPVMRGTRGEVRRPVYMATTSTTDPTMSTTSDPATRQPSGGDPSGGPTGGDPTGGDPSGDPTYGDPDPPAGGGDPPDPTTGWTELVPSADTRIIYVSSSEGLDSNDGLSEAKPVKTIAKGKSLVRMGYPDWLLLKSGDEWEESFGRWDVYGRSETERFVIGSYGDGPRPLLKCGGYGLFMAGHGIAHVALVDVDFWAHTRDPAHPGFDPSNSGPGLRILGGADDVLVEGCRFRMFGTNIVIEMFDRKRSNGIQIRRNVIADAYSTTSHSQGMFVGAASRLLIEENIFDHNGWHEAIVGAEPTHFNHNIYLTSYDTTRPIENLVVRGNVLANGSALGIKIYAGAPRAVLNTLVEGNLFYACADGIRQHAGAHPGTVDAVLRDNVFIGLGRVLKGVPQSFGASLGSVELATVSGNIFAHKPHDSIAYAIRLEGTNEPFRDVEITRNVVYHWKRGNIRVESANLASVNIRDNVVDDIDGLEELQRLVTGASTGIHYSGNTYNSPMPSNEWFRVFDRRTDLLGWVAATGATNERVGRVAFVDPDRTLDTYDLVVGGSGRGQEFVERAREMDRENWNPALVGAAVVEYFQEGFAPIAP